MKPQMPFGYYWKIYIDKVGGEGKFFEFEQMFYEPEHGFMTWSLDPDMTTLTIHKVAGDGKFWRRKSYDMFKLGKELYGIKKLRVSTIRNPKAFARFFGGTVTLMEMNDRGQEVYWLETEEVL